MALKLLRPSRTALVTTVVDPLHSWHGPVLCYSHQLGKAQGRQAAPTASQHPGAQLALDEQPGRRLLPAGWSARRRDPQPPVRYLAEALEAIAQTRIMLNPRSSKVVADGQVQLAGLWVVTYDKHGFI